MRLNPSPSARAASNASKPVRLQSDAWVASKSNASQSGSASPPTSSNAPLRLAERIVVTLRPSPHVRRTSDKGLSWHLDDAHPTTHEQRQRVSARHGELVTVRPGVTPRRRCVGPRYRQHPTTRRKFQNLGGCSPQGE